MPEESVSGFQSSMSRASQGAAVVGDAATPLTASSWYRVKSKASVSSVLPVDEGQIFWSGSTPITPIVGDDVYLLTKANMCVVDIEINKTKGSLDTTNKCSNGYVQYLSDGFTELSGSGTGYILTDEDGNLNDIQREMIERFIEVYDDDGVGNNITVNSKNDDQMILFIEYDRRKTSTGDYQIYLIVPAVLTENPESKPIRGIQSFDFSWVLGQLFRPQLYVLEVV